MDKDEFNSIVLLLKMNEHLSMDIAFNDIVDIRVGNKVIGLYNDIKWTLYKYLEENLCKEKEKWQQ